VLPAEFAGRDLPHGFVVPETVVPDSGDAVVGGCLTTEAV